jgi:hypothetical protein
VFTDRNKYAAEEYRRPKGGFGYKRWHFCRNCPKWPNGTYDMQRHQPVGHDLCRDCRRMADQGRCTGPRWF